MKIYLTNRILLLCLFIGEAVDVRAVDESSLGVDWMTSAWKKVSQVHDTFMIQDANWFAPSWH